MSFLGSTIPPTAEEEPPLANDGFAPAIDLQAVRAAIRLDGTVTPARLRHAVTNAVLEVNAAIADWRAAQRAAGYDTLADVPGPRLGEERALVLHYLRAVYASAHASLVEAYRDFDTTGTGDKRAEKLELSADALRRDSLWAIADLVGRRRTTVELI